MRGALAWSGTDYAGLTIQSLTTVQRDALSPSNGAVIYNTDETQFEFYQASGWVAMAPLLADYKESVQIATTADITLSGEQTIDGVLTSASRILVKSQSTGSENGIYVTDAGAWTRSTDFDANAEVTAGATVFVSEGTANGDTTWQLTTDDPIVVATTALSFAQIAGTGNGITESGTNIYFGTSAGASLTTGTRNLLGGINAGTAQTAQHNNVILGYDAGKALTSGDGSNIFIGKDAGIAATSSYNILIGAHAGEGITSGANNVEISTGSPGSGTVAGDFNVLIGAGTNNSGDNSYSIGINGATTADNQLVFGAQTPFIDDCYIGNGVTAPAPQDVAINGTGGFGTDIQGADITLASGKGTGSGTGGDILFKISAAGGTGTTLRSLATVGQLRASDNSFQVTAMRNSPELEQTLTDQATVAWDCDSGANANVTIAGNRTMDAPTNIKNGARYTLHIIQDPTGTRTMGWNSVFKFAGGSTPTLSTGGNDVDIFEFVARGGNLEEVSQSLNVS